MVFVRLATPVLALAAVLASASAAPHVDPSVHRTLRQQASVNLIVTMKHDTKAALASVQEAEYDSRGARISAVVTRLQENAIMSQLELSRIVSQESSGLFKTSKPYWISNQMYIEGATFQLVEKLATLSSVKEIREELRLSLPVLATTNATVSSIRPLANEYGVTKIAAPTVWATGNTGQGLVVAAIDTGVLGTHTALKGNFLGEYGWFDPEAKKAAPYDGNGHGTHTMGTIAGAGGIGVAPGAKWMACKGCRTDDCPESDLLDCAQFITCPTDTNGNNPDCSMAPVVVSNSWGGGQGDTFYQAAIDAWHAAGIIPVFANGNSGPACTTANSPADAANVIAVGATSSSDGLASFSSKGPTVTGLLKPDISAPGVSVRSAWNTGNSAYNTISGTSMATPHVSGLVALLLKAKPGLTYNQVKEALIKGVDTTTLRTTGYTCGGTRDGTFPNNQYGYGRVNAVKAIAAAPEPTPAPTPEPTTVAPTPEPTTETPTLVPTPEPVTDAPTPAPSSEEPTPTSA